MAVNVDLSLLDEPLHEDDWEYLRDNAPQYLDKVEKAIRAGATPQAIFQHYMKLAPHRYALWLRVKHAAMYVQGIAK